MPISRSTSAMARSESIIRWAASTLCLVVIDLRVRDMRIFSQWDPRSRYPGVHFRGEPQKQIWVQSGSMTQLAGPISKNFLNGLELDLGQGGLTGPG